MRQIRLGHSAVPETAEKAIRGVFRSGQYSPGRKVREFEEQWARRHGAKHAIFVNSGTDALRLSLLALKEKYGWRDGSGVLVPALTFVATVNTVIQANLTPVFCDVGHADFLMNPYNYGHDSTGREEPWEWRSLKAVMPVHLFGQRCGDKIYALAKKYKLKVIEDSCETILNKPRGDVSCHSTYMAHHVTTGVGGFAVTNDNGLNMLIRSFANHGRSTGYIPGYKSLGLGKDLIRKRFRFDRVGYSCRGTEFEAVLGISQLKNLEENMEKRRKVFVKLAEMFVDLGDFQTVGVDNNTCMMFPVVILEGSRKNRDAVCLKLERAGIETRYMMPITNQPCYRDFFKEDRFSVADGINKRGFYVPCHEGMTPKDVQRIRDVLIEK